MLHHATSDLTQTPLLGIGKCFKLFAFSVFQCTVFDIRKSSGLRLFVMITTILLIYAMAQVNVVRLQQYSLILNFAMVRVKGDINIASK